MLKEAVLHLIVCTITHATVNVLSRSNKTKLLSIMIFNLKKTKRRLNVMVSKETINICNTYNTYTSIHSTSIIY
jgi:hypothetical protein